MEKNRSLLFRAGKTVYYRNFHWKNLKPKWKEDFYEVDFRGQKLKFCYAPVGDLLISKYLTECLIFLRDEIPSYLIKRDIQQGDCVVDCGAHHGSFSIYASKKVGNSGRVLALEPDPKNREFLQRNILLNNCTNVQVLETAVFDKDSYLELTQQKASSTIIEGHGIKVRVNCLDKILEEEKINFSDVSFIKMDIEGAEIEAIEGARKTLTEGNPFLAIASYHIRDGKKTFEHLERRLAEFGYSVETGFPKHLTTWAHKNF